ncbi:unnamed protein product [Zymoseptoria tritici ST99CH_1A5]|uniref:Uncharacterized protein n=1 Tax=Zymoseptoria tritici ST99CH_1A5 TaxID=1276529 RepID=A0A1Y6LVP5_ZYMTR|nr:unnamed protein product [Zymoseptoria tritici ST99CH_1A5]
MGSFIPPSKSKPPTIPTNQRPNLIWCAWCCYHGKLECDLQNNQPCSRCADFNSKIHTQPAGTPLHDCYQAADGAWTTGWRQGEMEKKLRNAAVADNLPLGVFPDNANGRFIGPCGQRPNQQQARGPPQAQNHQFQQQPRGPPQRDHNQNQQRPRGPPRPQDNQRQQGPLSSVNALRSQHHPPQYNHQLQGPPRLVHPYGRQNNQQRQGPPSFANPYPSQYQPPSARLPYGSYAPQPSFDPRYNLYGAEPQSAFTDRSWQQELARQDRERREAHERAERAADADRLALLFTAGVRPLPGPAVPSELHGYQSTLLDQRDRLLAGRNTTQLTNTQNDTAQQQPVKNVNNKRQREEDEDDEIQPTSPREPSVSRGRRSRRSDPNENQKRIDKSTFFQNGRPTSKSAKEGCAWH